MGEDTGVTEQSPQTENRPLKDLADKAKDAVDGFDFDERTIEQIAQRPLERRTWQETLYLLSTIPAGIVATFCWSIGGPLATPLAITLIGIPLVALMFVLFRWFARFERKRVKLLGEEPIESSYAELTGNPLDKAIAFLSDVQTWKDMGWMLVLSLFALPFAVLALGTWLIAAAWIIYPLWGWWVPTDFSPIGWLSPYDTKAIVVFATIPVGILMLVVASWICAGLTYALTTISKLLLGPHNDQKLQGRVTELERTRKQSVSQQTTEMTRIERDLHDGAQARLVALAMDLGMAEQKIEEDPEAAKQLLAEARDEAQRTLQELRDLVRGIGPQILRDKGLNDALVPIAARSPIPVSIEIDLDERPGEAPETAAYFVASESLANAIKHSQAKQINLNIWRHEDWLYVRVSDNGVGGAKLDDSSGLQGLKARVEAVDGRFIVESPSGGPTIIDAWLPFKETSSE